MQQLIAPRSQAGLRAGRKAAREKFRGYVLTHLGDNQTEVVVVDETGFLKKGTKSAI